MWATLAHVGPRQGQLPWILIPTFTALGNSSEEIYFGLLAARRIRRKMIVLLPLGGMRPFTLMPFDPSVLDIDSEYLLVRPLSPLLLPFRILFTIFVTVWRSASFILRRCPVGLNPSRLPPLKTGHRRLWLETSSSSPTAERDRTIHSADRVLNVTPARGSLKVGREYLRKRGIGDSDWFVCIHVRELGYYDDAHTLTPRCASIERYGEAITAITEAGGWVIRVGDPTMTPLPTTPRVLDLAIDQPPSAGRLMSYVTASCRFFICMQSGPHDTAMLFGRPRLIMNMYSPAFGLPFLPSDAGVFKYVSSMQTGESLTPAEQLGSLDFFGPHGHMSVGGSRYTELGARDIAEATRIYLDYLDSDDHEFIRRDLRSELWFQGLERLHQSIFEGDIPLDKHEYRRLRSQFSDHLAHSIIFPDCSDTGREDERPLDQRVDMPLGN